MANDRRDPSRSPTTGRMPLEEGVTVAEAIGKDDKLQKKVGKMSTKASTKVKQGARSFLKKYNE